LIQPNGKKVIKLIEYKHKA